MTDLQAESVDPLSRVQEIPERLDEQHTITTKVLGFLIHPSIPTTSPNLKVADIGAGSGIWLFDVARQLPPTCQFTGFDVTPSALPPKDTWPSNVVFEIQDMFAPFPAADLGTYDVVAVRFISSAMSRADWTRATQNLITLLKPGGWLQWIESCNFALYNDCAGTSRAACQEIYDGCLELLRGDDEPIIGLLMREARNLRRDDVYRDLGLLDVHEDVFSTDRLQDPGLDFRDKGTRNIILCFIGILEKLSKEEGSGWTQERINKLKEGAMKEIDTRVYHTLDQMCIIGRKGQVQDE